MTNKLVRCPECSEVFNYYQSENRPFCSSKCKNVDLNMWFDEEYRVPTQAIFDPMELVEESNE
jgi:endogenous inhibitor of DNA gyrase (YacG/DUF329 family)